ncbi:MAG: hypothetical protein AAGB16_04280 [Pseudomonadota bacterium]
MGNNEEWRPLGTLYGREKKKSGGNAAGWIIGIVLFLIILAAA